MTELDDQVVAEFRANAGVVLDAMGGHFSSIHLLLLHNTGWRTGKQYVTPLLYVEDGDRYVLIGSNGGAEKEPAWVAKRRRPGGGVNRGGRAHADGDADDPAEWCGTGPPSCRGGGLLARHPRIPDPHHPHIPVDRLEPGPRFCAPQRHTAAKAGFDREGASSPIPLAPETTPGA